MYKRIKKCVWRNGVWKIHFLIHALLVTELGPSFLSLEAVHSSQGVSSPG